MQSDLNFSICLNQWNKKCTNQYPDTSEVILENVKANMEVKKEQAVELPLANVFCCCFSSHMVARLFRRINEILREEKLIRWIVISVSEIKCHPAPPTASSFKHYGLNFANHEVHSVLCRQFLIPGIFQVSAFSTENNGMNCKAILSTELLELSWVES